MQSEKPWPQAGRDEFPAAGNEATDDGKVSDFSVSSSKIQGPQILDREVQMLPAMAPERISEMVSDELTDDARVSDMSNLALGVQ